VAVACVVAPTLPGLMARPVTLAPFAVAGAIFSWVRHSLANQ
jgi:hypothetical protein